MFNIESNNKLESSHLIQLIPFQMDICAHAHMLIIHLGTYPLALPSQCCGLYSDCTDVAKHIWTTQHIVVQMFHNVTDACH